MMLNTLVNALPRRDVRSLVQAAAAAAGVNLEAAKYSAAFDGAVASSRATVILEQSEGPFVACALYTTEPLTTRGQVFLNGNQLCAEPSELVGLFEDPTVDGIGLVVPLSMARAQYLDVVLQATSSARVIVEGFHLHGDGAERLCTALRALGVPWVMRVAMLGNNASPDQSKDSPDVVEVRRLIRVSGGAVSSARLQIGRARLFPKETTNTNDFGGPTASAQNSQVSLWLQRSEKVVLSQIDPSGAVQTTLLAVSRRVPEKIGEQLPSWA
jgi:hypothetical protein